MVNARVLKFHLQIPNVKIVDPYFFSCPSHVPFLSYVPLKTKFEKSCVQDISKKVLAKAFIFDIPIGVEKKIT